MSVMALVLVASVCFGREPLGARMLHIADSFNVLLNYSTELTDGKEAPPLCGSSQSLKEALARSLKGSGLQEDIVDGHIVLLGTESFAVSCGFECAPDDINLPQADWK